MRTRILGFAALLIAVLLSPLGNIEACGPFFEPDIFVRATAPDDLVAFAAGQLGILQARFDSSEYAVAYRYLNGGKLSDSERTAYLHMNVPPQTYPDWSKLTPDQIAAAQAAQQKAHQDAQPAGEWLQARDKYLPPLAAEIQKQSFPTDYEGTFVFEENYLNCPDPAFANATLTLQRRAGSWGAQSKWLADWITGQDAVFSNCAGKNASSPAAAPADSPALLQADRAYQLAAAAFYAKRYDDAARMFAAISSDKNSPWRDWGDYLAARATVRKAFAMGKASDPYSGDRASYDVTTMQRAQQMLESLLAQPNPMPSRAVVQSELNFIRIRTEPDKRASEISAALAGPAPDANFAQDLQDLGWLLTRQTSNETNANSAAPLLGWIAAWRGAGTAASAYATWQQTHALPWLVMAMVKADPSDAFVPALIHEAATVAPGTPAYDTVYFHRVRLLIALHRADEARTLLDAALPALRRQKPGSNLNALLGERMAVARSFNEFLEYAPRRILSSGSEGEEDLQGQCNERAHAVNAIADCPDAKQPYRFDEDSVQIFNRKTPLPLLIEAAKSPSMPQNLGQDLAVMAWTRSVLLEEAPSASALAPLLPKPVHDVAGSSIDFAADLAILRNPGIRPYLESGISRVASYSYFDELRDNWWCQPWSDQPGDGERTHKDEPPPSFLSADQVKLADSELERLQRLPDSAAIIGQRVVDYARAHPDDPQVPEALALTVRATHYACQAWNPNPTGEAKSEYTPVSKAAFEFLHKHYPKSEWTLKTRYYY
ncbi:MAG TPA: hypothetical protein VLZ50_16560 [Terracidiphilus sp.]|nr:hypothetical protein [Terracidiphilus sp.]